MPHREDLVSPPIWMPIGTVQSARYSRPEPRGQSKPCKIAMRAPIRIGRLLVTADKEGTAMKSLPLDLGGTTISPPENFDRQGS